MESLLDVALVATVMIMGGRMLFTAWFLPLGRAMPCTIFWTKSVALCKKRHAHMTPASCWCLTGLKKMEGYGVKATEIRVVGGGSKNRLWRRIIADSFQLPLRFPTEPESAALGAALQAAAVHAGVATPEFIDSHSPPLADLVNHTSC